MRKKLKYNHQMLQKLNSKKFLIYHERKEPLPKAMPHIAHLLSSTSIRWNQLILSSINLGYLSAKNNYQSLNKANNLWNKLRRSQKNACLKPFSLLAAKNLLEKQSLMKLIQIKNSLLLHSLELLINKVSQIKSQPQPIQRNFQKVNKPKNK